MRRSFKPTLELLALPPTRSCVAPVVQIEDLRKVYVRRSDACAYLNTRTFSKSEVPAQLGHSRKSLTLDAYSHVLVGD